MPGMRTSAWAGQITDAKRMTTWEGIGYFTRGALYRGDQRRGPVSGALSWTQPAIPVAAVCKADRVVQVSLVHSANGDRQPRRKRLGHTRTDRCDYDRCDKPSHSKCMIAHGSA